MVRSTDLPRPDSGSGSRWGTSRPLHTPPQFRLPNGHSDRSANASANFAIRTLWCPTSPALGELALHAARFGQSSGYSHQPSCQCHVSVALRAGIVRIRAGGARSQPPRARGWFRFELRKALQAVAGPRARGGCSQIFPHLIRPRTSAPALAGPASWSTLELSALRSRGSLSPPGLRPPAETSTHGSGR